MCDILHLEWTATPKTPPRPILACSGCGAMRPFRSSGRIRLNANGKRLDAWLIYRCIACDGTWNRPIFERQTIRAIDPAMLDAMQASTPDFVARIEFDAQALKVRASRIEESDEIDMRKTVLHHDADWRRIAITLALPYPTGLRLDRLLAAELPLSRSRLQLLFDNGEIRIGPERKDALKRGIRDGTLITLDLRDEAERLVVGKAAIGRAAMGG
ncbi:Mlr4111 protein [Neorhizobium galegae bv. orientalis]|nr:Mlr4111 protein [Neorhizobium galegae bv. orientalis]